MVIARYKKIGGFGQNKKGCSWFFRLYSPQSDLKIYLWKLKLQTK